MATTLTGGCLCGGVRFELTEPLTGASYCHCTRCQRRTGTAASAHGRIVPGSLVVTAGEELVSIYTPPEGFSKAFCSVCGSALWAAVNDQVVGIRLGVFDSDPGVRPSYRQFVDYAAAWEPVPDDGLPRFPEGRPPEA